MNEQFFESKIGPGNFENAKIKREPPRTPVEAQKARDNKLKLERERRRGKNILDRA